MGGLQDTPSPGHPTGAGKGNAGIVEKFGAGIPPQAGEGSRRGCHRLGLIKTGENDAARGTKGQRVHGRVPLNLSDGYCQDSSGQRVRSQHWRQGGGTQPRSKRGDREGGAPGNLLVLPCTTMNRHRDTCVTLA